MISDRKFFKRTGILLLGITCSIALFGNENTKEVSLKGNIESVNTPKKELVSVASTKTNNSQLEKLIKNQVILMNFWWVWFGFFERHKTLMFWLFCGQNIIKKEFCDWKLIKKKFGG